MDSGQRTVRNMALEKASNISRDNGKNYGKVVCVKSSNPKVEGE